MKAAGRMQRNCTRRKLSERANNKWKDEREKYCRKNEDDEWMTKEQNKLMVAEE